MAKPKGKSKYSTGCIHTKTKIVQTKWRTPFLEICMYIQQYKLLVLSNRFSE
jgi:hypothetical protein